MENIRLLNETELIYLCKIILKEERDISVGKTVMKYARLDEDKPLFRKIHGKLLESGKFVESNEVDKYEMRHLRFTPKKSWKERYWWAATVINVLIGLILGYLFRTTVEPNHIQQLNQIEFVRPLPTNPDTLHKK